MSSRQSRSTSIPIPRSPSSVSSSRNIESVLSIPLALPVRPRLASAHTPQHLANDEDHRSLGVSHAQRAPSSVSPTRSYNRPSLAPGIVGRGAPRSIAIVEPRVIRAGIETSNREPSPSSSSFPSSSSQARLLNGEHKSSSVRHVDHPGAPGPSTSYVAFPRPQYLEYSALRDMLQFEKCAPLVPARKPHQVPTTIYTHGYTAMSPFTDSDDDGNASPPPTKRLIETQSKTVSENDQILRLPLRWSQQDRHPILNVSSDGRDLFYQGSSCGPDKDAAAARTTYPIPPACGIYYYEVEINCKEPKSHISVGFSAPNVRFTRLPGWETNSWGYHGDDGCSYAAEQNGTPYGQAFGTGDVIGCGIDFTIQKAFFTKNGTLIGPIFDNIPKDINIYPSIGLQHAGESIRANFGQEHFRYDIDYHVQQQRNLTWSKIVDSPLDTSMLKTHILTRDNTKLASEPPTEEQLQIALNELVESYLIHHGYAKTARAFQMHRKKAVAETLPCATVMTTENSTDIEIDDTRREPEVPTSDMDCRTRIVAYVAAGKIDAAISDTEKHYPDVLKAEDGLMLFKLRCRKFVELILETTELKKKMKEDLSLGNAVLGVPSDPADGWLDEDGMDVEEDTSFLSSHPFASNGYGTSNGLYGMPHMVKSKSSRVGARWSGSTVESYESTLNNAIAYGQKISNDFKADTRPEVKQIFKQTFGIVAWEDPTKAGGSTAEVVGQEARVILANELNEAILGSQGLPTRPALETLYRHTSACIVRLCKLGEGAAAFADMSREFLEK